MAAKQAVSMVVLAELAVIKLPAKVNINRTANTVVTKASEEATIMVTANNSVEDGAATTGINGNWIVATRPGRLPPLSFGL